MAAGSAAPTAKLGPGSSGTVRLAAGKTQIYVAPDACAVTRYAADELARFLGESMGSEVPVTNAFLAGFSAQCHIQRTENNGFSGTGLTGHNV